MIETYRKRFDFLARQLAHNASNNTRIDAAAEHSSHWYIGDHAFFYRPTYMMLYTFEVLVNGRWLCFFKGDIPVALLANVAIRIKQPVTGEYFVNARKKSSRSGNVADTQEINDSLHIGFSSYQWMT